jgi:hypothetical protein
MNPTGYALQVAGRRFREVLSDAEINGVWTFAWLPETSGKVTHRSFILGGKPTDPIELLDPANLAMVAFLDAFARQPDEVIKLLTTFRVYIREKVGKPGPSLVHAAFINEGTGKEAAHVLAEAESNVGPTLAAVESAGRRLRRHAASLESAQKGKGPYWPHINSAGAEPIPRKRGRKADKKGP